MKQKEMEWNEIESVVCGMKICNLLNEKETGCWGAHAAVFPLCFQQPATQAKTSVPFFPSSQSSSHFDTCDAGYCTLKDNKLYSWEDIWLTTVLNTRSF